MGQPPDSADRQALQRWIEERLIEHKAAVATSTWSLYDLQGNQIARAPLSAANLGRNFAFRDYFHGQGHDFEPGTPGLAPIRRPHRSIVFRSRESRTSVVSFSVPILEAESSIGDHPAAGPPHVLGVLAMSVDTGHFGVLELDLGSDQVAVLADLDADETGRPGLILHHPALPPASPDTVSVYLPRQRVTMLEGLRQRELQLHRAPRDPTSPPAKRDVVTLDPNYTDPMGRSYAGRWLAAFEPVIVDGRPPPIDDTGGIVIVQERDDGQGAR